MGFFSNDEKDREIERLRRENASKGKEYERLLAEKKGMEARLQEAQAKTRSMEKLLSEGGGNTGVDENRERALTQWAESLKKKDAQFERRVAQLKEAEREQAAQLKEAKEKQEAELRLRVEVLRQQNNNAILALKKREEALQGKENELEERSSKLSEDFARLHQQAVESFNEKFLECQARYYQRYKELEEKFEAEFTAFAAGREERILELQKSYLEKSSDFGKRHEEILENFRLQSEEEAGRAAARRAETLAALERSFYEETAAAQKKLNDSLLELEAGHQESLKEAQSKYTNFYLEFQTELQGKEEELARRFSEAVSAMEASYLTRQEELQRSLSERMAALSAELEGASARRMEEERSRREEEWLAHQRLLTESFHKNEDANRELVEGLTKSRQELSARELALAEKEEQASSREEALALRERMLKAKKQELEEREAVLEDELEERMRARLDSWEAERERLEEEIERLRDREAQAEQKSAYYGEVDELLGGRSLEESIRRLREERAELASGRKKYLEADEGRAQAAEKKYRGAVEELEQVRSELARLKMDFEKNESSVLRSQAEHYKLAALEQEKESLEKLLEAANRTRDLYFEELKRITSQYDKGQERTARVAILEEPVIKIGRSRMEKSAHEGGEIEWLKGIETSCKDFGIEFPRRILYAFHTALKTSEWSPLAVLAGVSGTGKSELPRLYAAFGGMNFCGVSVQPNWDSQESMLGFFNSIDNKFDAQPVLRFLVQSQKVRENDFPLGMGDVMNLVLLDEMNLAYVELYFAEFLSKLETRRGMKVPPSIDVKLGAGQEPYSLPLGRNVLWSGTMNQDETTKSLSDKVLDRSFVINFPRPQHLVSRAALGEIKYPSEFLTYDIWDSWCSKQVAFKVAEIKPYKELVEKINHALGDVGRAIGHRVWQSMEYYMSNYPGATGGDADQRKAAMNAAFVDQLVQKVMPKLRGIEDRGGGAKCLNNIESFLGSDEAAAELLTDFRQGREFGGGQFIWNSAEYLQREAEEEHG